MAYNGTWTVFKINQSRATLPCHTLDALAYFRGFINPKEPKLFVQLNTVHLIEYFWNFTEQYA